MDNMKTLADNGRATANERKPRIAVKRLGLLQHSEAISNSKTKIIRNRPGAQFGK
jgi:hypothetical protein